MSETKACHCGQGETADARWFVDDNNDPWMWRYILLMVTITTFVFLAVIGHMVLVAQHDVTRICHAQTHSQECGR